jgi:hypothetical protein
MIFRSHVAILNIENNFFSGLGFSPLRHLTSNTTAGLSLTTVML